MVRDELVYFNDFEGNSPNNIDGGAISLNNSKVIGDFNNDDF